MRLTTDQLLAALSTTASIATSKKSTNRQSWRHRSQCTTNNRQPRTIQRAAPMVHHHTHLMTISRSEGHLHHHNNLSCCEQKPMSSHVQHQRIFSNILPKQIFLHTRRRTQTWPRGHCIGRRVARCGSGGQQADPVTELSGARVRRQARTCHSGSLAHHDRDAD